MAQAQQPCVICNVPTTKKCVDCAIAISGRPVPYYCSVAHQRQDWNAGHKQTCSKTRTKHYMNHVQLRRPVDHLCKAIRDDMLPSRTSPCYIPFGFENCRTEAEESKLLSVYVGLIKYLEADVDEIHEAQQLGNEQLKQFIIFEYETLRPEPEIQGEYFPWFLANQHIIFP